MEMLSRLIGWADYILTWVWVIWFGVGIVVGGVLLVFDEWRLHRARPKSAEVWAYASQLVVRHDREAFRINGDAMVAARDVKNFDRYRFLKEVAGVLLDEPFGGHMGTRGSAVIDDASGSVCFPGASPSHSEHP